MTDNLKLEPLGANKVIDESATLLEKGVTVTTTKTGQQVEDDYDPHLHRDIEHPTTNTETLVHLLKGCLGTGILAMPEAFMFSGMAVGIISTAVIGLLCTYCLHVLVRAQYAMCKKLKVALLTYPESMKVACEIGPPCLRRFAPFAPGITNFFLIFYQLGICCVYIVFVGENIKAVADGPTSNPILNNTILNKTTPVENPIIPDAINATTTASAQSTNISLTFYILMCFVPFFLITCIRNLKLLAPFSVLANIITFVTFGVVGYYVCQQLPSFGDLPQVGTAFNYPLYFGTTLFSLQAVGVVIALENNMKTPKKFGSPGGVLNVGMGLVTVIYILMAMMGYWRYGDKIKASITLNFPSEETLAQSIRILYSIAIYISYGLQGYVPVQIIYSNYIEKHLVGASNKKKLFYEYLLRLGCVLLTFVLAISIPLLGLFISLVGAFCLSALGIAFPAILELCAYWPDRLGKGNWILWKDLLLILVGIIGLIAGSYSCIYSIIAKLTAPN